MITCERCGTQNLAGSRYCDECGAALWLAGRSGDRANPQANGNEGSGNKEVSVTVAHQANPPVAGLVAQQQSAGAVAVAGKTRHSRSNAASPRASNSDWPEGSDIGRWDADGGVFPDVDLDTDDPEAKVSRRHARISCENGQYLIEDLGSTNGTFVNRGRRLKPSERHPVNEGDEIIVGKTFLRFHLAK